jgi:phosphonate transport system substrate-binding protein
MKLRLTLTGAALTALTFTIGPSYAYECWHGDLDDRYCDADGDKIADFPVAADWLDPETLTFAYTPVEDPVFYKEVWADFLEHIEDITGKDVTFFPVQSDAEQIEAMRSGHLHIAGFNPGSIPLAVTCAGFRPFTIMASEDVISIYKSQTSPTTGYGVVHNLKPELQAAIKDAFFSFEWDGTKL